MSSSAENNIQFALSDMQLTSTDFAAEAPIPTRHTGEGEDISPALHWTHVPDGTQSFAVICHDPDAPVLHAGGHYGFVHWALYNIPANVTELPAGCEGYSSGLNDFGKTGYNGPLPPEGHGQHRYYFWVIALDKTLALDAGLNLYQLLEKIQPHTIGMNRLTGTYQRG